MDAATLRSVRDRQPFEPFEIVMKTGERFPVISRDHIFVPPSTPTQIVVANDGGGVTLGISHILELSPLNPPSRRAAG